MQQRIYGRSVSTTTRASTAVWYMKSYLRECVCVRVCVRLCVRGARVRVDR